MHKDALICIKLMFMEGVSVQYLTVYDWYFAFYVNDHIPRGCYHHGH